MLLIATCTSVYKQAQKQHFLNCLCLWGGAFTYILYFGVQTSTKTNLFLVVYCYVWCFFYRILYFDVQTGTKTNLFLVVYVYGVVLFLASCTSMYKQAPKQTYLKLFMFMEWCFYSHLVLWCTNRHQNKPILSCLSL